MSSQPKIKIVNSEDLINLGRLPVSASENPLFKTCKLIIDNNPSSSEAEEFLISYYQNLAHTDLNSLFNTSISALERKSFHNYFLPWIHKKPSRARDVAFTQKIAEIEVIKKVRKLKEIMISVQAKGYVPKDHSDRRHGHISGYFIESRKKRGFYVVAGNHRFSALSALGFEKIPVIYESVDYFKPRDRDCFGWKELPKVFSYKDIEKWPSVKSGFLKPEEAEAILESYLDFK